MADIYAFPQGAPNEARTTGRGSCACAAPPESMLTRPSGVPDKVWDAVLSVERMPRLSGVSYREIPVPCAMASFGIGVEMDCDETRSTGWIMVLYSHKYRNDWHSHWRCAAFAALPLPGNERDCLTPSIYWDVMADQIVSNMFQEPSPLREARYSAGNPTLQKPDVRFVCLGRH